MKPRLKISFCDQCPNHRVIADPDPSDSFNDDDCAIVCTKAENPTRGKSPQGCSHRRADASEYRVIESMLRPYEVGKVVPPTWCPLISKVAELKKLALSPKQQRLERKHGTPAEFAVLVYKSVPGMISMDEARDAVDKYNREWEAAG